MKEIHELKLHESTDIGRFEITKVPGGWIYAGFKEVMNRNGYFEKIYLNSVFVSEVK